MQHAHDTPFEVLVVDDNDNDVELMTIAFSRTRFDVNLTNVVNGDECLAYLRKEGKHAGAPTPDLVLLDINMPCVDGFEVLQAVDADPVLQYLPIVIVTSSEAEADVSAAWRLRCSSYVVKPIDFESFVRALRLLAEYWFTLVRLPYRTPAPRTVERDRS
jgi:two-component system response regulator